VFLKKGNTGKTSEKHAKKRFRNSIDTVLQRESEMKKDRGGKKKKSRTEFEGSKLGRWGKKLRSELKRRSGPSSRNKVIEKKGKAQQTQVQESIISINREKRDLMKEVSTGKSVDRRVGVGKTPLAK